jgi:hypothetical protein
VSVWAALKRPILYFLLGVLWGALIVAAAKPDHSNDAEIKSIQLDVARNSEKIAEIRSDIQAVKDWIAASDRQKVLDAEIEGQAHAKIDAHEKFVWLAMANLVGFIFLLVEFAIRVKKAKT